MRDMYPYSTYGCICTGGGGGSTHKNQNPAAEKGGHLAHAHTSHALRREAQLYGRIGRKGERAGRPITKGPLARRPPNTPDAHLCATPSNTAHDARIGVRVLSAVVFNFLRPAWQHASTKHSHTHRTHTHTRRAKWRPAVGFCVVVVCSSASVVKHALHQVGPSITRAW